MIQIISSSRYKIDKKEIKLFLEQLFQKRRISPQYDLNLIFVGKAKMKEIALKYKKENVALPVLSFPYQEKEPGESLLLGEIFICYPQTVLLAAERNKRVNDMILELIKHGVYNLCS